MKRREFLGSSAALLAAPKSLAATSSAKIPCAILGLGHAHSMGILQCLQDSPDFALVGVCEPDPGTRERYAQSSRLKTVRWLDERECLGNPDIRMVAVESDVPRLLGLGRKVVDAGKHLHLDKPAGTSLPEWRTLLDDADRQKLLVQMGYMFRYNPGFNFLRKLIHEGALGEIYSIQASMCTDLSPEKRQDLLFHPGGLMLK